MYQSNTFVYPISIAKLYSNLYLLNSSNSFSILHLLKYRS
nr:MAG TPA: hypothetical protein [Bacteriophage sp.]